MNKEISLLLSSNITDITSTTILAPHAVFGGCLFCKLVRLRTPSLVFQLVGAAWGLVVFTVFVFSAVLPLLVAFNDNVKSDPVICTRKQEL